MYCRACGAKIPDEGKFCPNCGCQSEEVVLGTAPKVGRASGSKKVTIIVIVSIAVALMIATGLIWNYHKGATQREINKFKNMVSLYPDKDEYEKAVAGWAKAVARNPQHGDDLQKQLDYYYAVVNAERAIEESDWNCVVENMETVIGIVSDEPENYLTLATAYVEKWDLYRASEILNKGYDITGDASLKNVSIWGPLSPVETAFYMLEKMPITRCEYMFSDDAIKSYIYVYGLPLAGASYICEEDKVKYITFLEYDDALIAGLFPQQVQESTIFADIITYFDLEYDAEGNIAAVTYDGKTFVTLKYENRKCVSITAQLGFSDMFLSGDMLFYSYDSSGRILEIEYDQSKAVFTYETSGSYSVELPEYDMILKFDNNGLLTGRDNEYDKYDSTSEDGHITSVWGEGEQRWNYQYKNGKIVSYEIGDEVRIIYSYDMVCGIEKLTRADVINNRSGSYEVIDLTYDAIGNLVSIYNEVDGNTMNLCYIDGRLEYWTVTKENGSTSMYVAQYDEVGRYIGRKGNK